MKRTPSPEAARLSTASLAALSLGVLVLDPAGNPVLANPAAQRLGLAGKPSTGPSGPLAAHRPHPAALTLADQVAVTGDHREIEVDLHQEMGGAPMSVALRALPLPEGHVLVEATDVTEAHRLARTRRDFVANVSHELKTPVGALRLLADALCDAALPAAGDTGFADPVSIRRFSERIQHESARLGRLVADLLELSRLLGAEPLPDPVPVPVDRIIAEVLDRSRTAAADNDTALCWAGQLGLTAYGSETQLVTALANLVENAIAYSPPNTTVTIQTESDERHLILGVTDEGIGIEAKYLGRIFERFYRIDKARSRATGGTGLGLAIVKHIASNHAGEVDVISTPGAGSTFTLRLPSRPPGGTAAASRPPHDRPEKRERR
ncbi:MAG: PAS domain-containing protein [Micromonosporaceae bacterium]|nr:PAS domain-containing protein [Micromonosporaceae bacterium]